MFVTGLRLHEAANLNVRDIAGKARLDIIGKQREIPLFRAIREEIEKFLVWKEVNGETIASDASLFIFSRAPPSWMQSYPA